MAIKEGVYDNLTSDDYHNDKESLSRSSLLDFKRSPYKYWANHINPDRPEKEVKESWEFGTAFHTLILEPELFECNYALELQKMPLLKDVGREMYELEKARRKLLEDSSKKILSSKDFNCLFEMRLSLKKHVQAWRLIEYSVYERSYFWRDKETGLMLKSRPDILHGNIYVDLKTIDDASPANFQREMARFGYHIQAAMVEDAILAIHGAKLSACINICVEKKYPYSVAIYIIDEEAIEYGRNEYKNILLNLQTCIMSGEYPDYETQTIGLPRWAI